MPTARLEIKGDTWDGNLVADGDRVYLMTREQITGFWGVLSVRSSADGGRTWGDPVQVSAAGGPSAARHTLTLGPDGSLWAAWSQIGAAPSTQQLILRRSRDEGRTWEAPIRASRPEVGLVGIPALVMTTGTSFVAFTDGDRGTVIVQALDADGAPTADPVELRATTRELYGDSPFFDAGIAAAAHGEQGLIVANDGSDLWRATQCRAWPAVGRGVVVVARGLLGATAGRSRRTDRGADHDLRRRQHPDQRRVIDRRWADLGLRRDLAGPERRRGVDGRGSRSDHGALGQLRPILHAGRSCASAMSRHRTGDRAGSMAQRAARPGRS